MTKDSVKYLDYFIQLKCAAPLLALGIYPNAKEITESVGAWMGLRRCLGAKAFGEDYECVVHGDGAGPRTGALLAFMTRWRVYSVDPRMKFQKTGVTRLVCVARPIEDFLAGFEWTKKIILVGVHSHADPKAYWPLAKEHTKVVYSNPCCVNQDLPGDPWHTKIEDTGILSPQNKINTWADNEYMSPLKKS